MVMSPTSTSSVPELRTLNKRTCELFPTLMEPKSWDSGETVRFGPSVSSELPMRTGHTLYLAGFPAAVRLPSAMETPHA